MNSTGLTYDLNSRLRFSFGNAGLGSNVTGDLLFTLKGIPAKSDLTILNNLHENFVYEDNGYLKIGKINRG